MNRASLDRGFGRCIVYRKYGASLRKYPNRTVDQIRAPEVQALTGRPAAKYRLLERDGLLAVGEVRASKPCIHEQPLSESSYPCLDLNL